MPAALTGEQLRRAIQALPKPQKPERTDAQDIADALREFGQRIPSGEVDTSAVESAIREQGDVTAAALERLAKAIAGNKDAIAMLAEALNKEPPAKPKEQWDMEIVERDRDGRAKKMRFTQVR